MPPEEMVGSLLPREGAQSAALPEGAGVRVDAPLAPGLDLPRIDIPVDFEFDTHRLTQDGMLALRALAMALGDPRLDAMRFQIAAHTDGRGSDATKLDLSVRRAEAIAAHLAAFYGIERDRLVPVGYGRSRLARPSDPGNPANRRVEIINLAPLS